jgi:Flp pilus assembly protein TadG
VLRMRGQERGSSDSEHGAAAVEMALVLPVLLIVVFGLIEFGFAFNAQIALTQAVREGVRVGAIGDETTMTAGNMIDRMDEAFLGIGGGTLTGTATPCDVDDTEGQAELAGELAYTTPIGNFGPFNLRAEAVMRCGG